MQDIKIEPLKTRGFDEKHLRQSILNGSTISIAQLFQIVKTFDKDFYINHRISEQKRDLSEQELISESKSEKEQTVQDVEKSKDATNIAAIKILKAVESENRLATPAEQETLSK